MRKTLVFGAALALICGSGVMTITSAQNDQGPEHLVITDGSPSSANPAYFPHRDHQNRLKDCGICHHGKGADGKQVPYKAGETKQQKCNTCHNKNADGVSLDGRLPGISPIQRAGHGRCQGCHKDKTSTKTPPVQLLACPTCHTKK
ncbi:cytochrome c3 family protein [Candidatus Electronema sp. PJ]|uniref:cytochrome c3 family protein n=1 Tax=Candidatus Electronema sp. PJ TaxID=3401572 RepID=UPI003AA98B99